MRLAVVWKDGKLNCSTCIIIDWDTGSARDCAGARTDRPESLVDLLFSPNDGNTQHRWRIG